jgi:hypothetical protein
MQIATLESGEIDYDELRAQLTANCARPAIINVNIGTTVKGAVDDLDRVLQILKVTALGCGRGGRVQERAEGQRHPSVDVSTPAAVQRRAHFLQSSV